MKRRQHRGLSQIALLFVALLSATTPAPAEEKAYPIKLTRPTEVGRKHTVSGEGAIIRKTVVILKGVRRERPQAGEGIKLGADVEVLAVTPKGRASKLSIRVNRCVGVSGDNEGELLPAGSLVLAEADGKDTKFTLVAGNNLPPATVALLRLFFNLKEDGRATEDELVGTVKGQAVGATWPVNAAGIVKDLAADDLVAKEEDVSGSSKLEAVEPAKDGNPECLRVVNTMTVKHFEAHHPAEALKALPAGIKTAKGTLSSQVTMSLPVEGGADVRDRTFSVKNQTTFSGTTDDGQPVEIETTMERAATIHIR